MGERTDRLADMAGVLRLALETGVGLLAVHVLAMLAATVGFHFRLEVWTGAFAGFVHILCATRMPWRPLGQRAGGRLGTAATLLAILVLIALPAWMRGSFSIAGSVTVILAFALFRLAAAAAASTLSVLSELADKPPSPMQRPGLAGCYAGGLDLLVGADDRASATAIMTMSEHAVREREEHRIGTVQRDEPDDDWLDLDRLPTDWLENSGALQEGRLAVAARRIFDIAAAGTLVLVTLPLMLLTAIAIRIETPGPILYRQERVGRNGRVFTVYKFRSMTVDAEANGSPVWAVPQDPRVTRVGRITRLTRIDEIPQVLNVLRGDMAFIGPRPERPQFVAQLERAIPHYADRAVVKPGITGWAQVRYRYGASVEDARMKLGYDLYYIRHRSLALDLRILAATVRVVVLQEGAR